MNESNQYDELLIRYLLNDLSSADELLVVRMIESDENVRERFEKLKNTWRFTALKDTPGKIDIDYEWNVFKQAVANNASEAATRTNEDMSLSEMDYPKSRSPKTKIIALVISTAAAASVLLMIGFKLNWWNSKRTAIPIATTKTELKSDLSFSIRHESNSSDQSKQIVLADSSVVLLAANSDISFKEPFQDNKRDIELSGEAHFKVFKDKTRPFTVFSGDIATTALGTSFTVTAYKNADIVRVKLFEGKVVIRPADNLYTKLKKDVYLLPGEELIYNNQTAIVKIRTFSVQDGMDNESRDLASTEDPSIPAKTEKETSWYMFNNQSLPNVFKQLEEMFNVQIDYSQKDVRKMYFIGKFYKTDSLETVLKQIGKLNSFKVRREKNKFIIY